MADSGISDRLVKQRSLIDQTCFEFIDVIYFGALNFLSQNTPDAVICWANHISVYWVLIKSTPKKLRRDIHCRNVSAVPRANRTEWSWRISDVRRHDMADADVCLSSDNITSETICINFISSEMETRPATRWNRPCDTFSWSGEQPADRAGSVLNRERVDASTTATAAAADGRDSDRPNQRHRSGRCVRRPSEASMPCRQSIAKLLLCQWLIEKLQQFVRSAESSIESLDTLDRSAVNYRRHSNVRPDQSEKPHRVLALARAERFHASTAVHVHLDNRGAYIANWHLPNRPD